MYLADVGLNEGDVEELTRILEGRHGKLNVIEVRGNDHAVIVRTNGLVASEIRDKSASIVIAGKHLTTVLTSGGIGKLKRRAAETSANAEVPQR